jgi:hypothetical protein
LGAPIVWRLKFYPSVRLGAMILAEIASSGVPTRHLDTGYHFIREQVEDGYMKVIFARIEDKYTFGKV